MSTIFPEDKHREILANCVDVPEEKPSFPLPLQKAGISGKTVWIRLAGNKGGHIPFNAAIHVNLEAGRRGIHMSRIEQAITSLHDRIFTSVPEYGALLADRVLTAQKAQCVSVQLTGRLPFEQMTPVSRLWSVDTIEVRFTATLEKSNGAGILHNSIGVGMHHLTACPCTLAYNEKLFNRSNDPWPHPTHSQRSKTELSVGPPPGSPIPAYQDLTDVLDKALHISRDLLKRPDETELVLKAHKLPQFAEDTVREVARRAGEKFRDILAPATRIEVRSISLESIHIHDVECWLDTCLSDILAAMQS